MVSADYTTTSTQRTMVLRRTRCENKDSLKSPLSRKIGVIHSSVQIWIQESLCSSLPGCLIGNQTSLSGQAFGEGDGGSPPPSNFESARRRGSLRDGPSMSLSSTHVKSNS